MSSIIYIGKSIWKLIKTIFGPLILTLLEPACENVSWIVYGVTARVRRRGTGAKLDSWALYATTQREKRECLACHSRKRFLNVIQYLCRAQRHTRWRDLFRYHIFQRKFWLPYLMLCSSSMHMRTGWLDAQNLATAFQRNEHSDACDNLPRINFELLFVLIPQSRIYRCIFIATSTKFW